MGAPTIGGDLTASINEGDVSVTGDLDDINDGFLTGTNDDTFTITAQGSYGTATINAGTGEWSYALDNSNPDVIALGPGDTLVDAFTVFMDDANQGDDTADVSITINGVICFAAGTLIQTPSGSRPIEQLVPGDLVVTADGRSEAIRWIGHRHLESDALRLNPKLCPVRISAGALGRNLPQRDLLVSRQHRILMRSKIVSRMFGVDEVLIPAIKLVGLPGIIVDEAVQEVDYYHLLLDQHEVILAEGAPAESLFTGAEALQAAGDAARQEIRAIFPECFEIEEPQPARPIVRGKRQKALVARHLRNKKPVLA